MRLIDADKLLGSFIKSGQKNGMKHGCKLGENWLLDYNDIKAVIDNAPTVERPQGEWNTRNGGIVFPFWERYECSVCHEYNGCSNFCPYCGADMRGENK